MYCKRKIRVYLICLLLIAIPAQSKSLFEKFKDLISFELPKDIFASINSDIVGKLQAKNVKLLLPNKIEIDDVEVIDEFGKRVLFGKRVKLTVSLLSLLTNNIRITDAVIEAPFFNYTIKKEVHNIVRVFDSRAPSKGNTSNDNTSSKRITIENLRLINGRFKMLHDAGVEIVANNISAEGKFWVKNGPFGIDIKKLAVESGDILAAGMKLPLFDLLARDLFISDELVYAKTLNALYEKARISATGTVYIDQERYDLQCQIDAPPGTYPQGLKPVPFITPAFKAGIEMLGTLTNPEFLTNVTFSGTDFNGLTINNGRAELQINQHQVFIRSADIKVGEQGTITASGNIDIDNSKFSIDSKQKAVFVQELAKFLDFSVHTRGIFSAGGTFDGSFAGKFPIINISSHGKITDGAVDEFVFPEASSFNFNGRLVLDRNLKINEARITDASGLNINFSGESDFVKKLTLMNYHLKCVDVSRYFSLPFKSVLKGLDSKGRISFGTNGLSIEAKAFAKMANIYGFDGSEISGLFEFENNKLFVKNLSANAYDGSLFLDLVVDKFDKEKLLAGNVSIEDVDLSGLSKSFDRLKLEGKIDAILSIAGNASSPSIGFSLSANDLAIDKIKLASAELEGSLHDDYLNIFKITSNTISGSLKGKNIFYNLKSKEIGGELFVDNLDISSAFSSYDIGVDGYLNGSIFIGGTLNLPLITAPLIVSKLTAYGFNLGSGAMMLSFSEQHLLGTPDKDLVFSASTNLSGNGSSSVGRFSFALNKKTINVEVNVEDIELNTAELGLLDKYVGVLGDVSGNFTAEGLIDSPIMNSNLTIKRYGFFDPVTRKEAKEISKDFGPATINVISKDGKIDLDFCASLQKVKPSRECNEDAELNLKVNGALSLDKISLSFDGKLDHKNLEEVFLPLKKEFISLGAKASIKGSLLKQGNESLDYKANVQIDKLYGNLPNIPNVALASPVSLVVTNDDIKFSKDALLKFSPGELTVGGSFSSSEIDMHAEGEIPLVLSRLFIPIIQNADGLAVGEIRIFGPLDSVMLVGNITPQYGSTFTLRRWLEPIKVKEGSIVFEKTGKASFKSKLNNIRLSIGDGKISLNGDIDKQYEDGQNNDSLTFDMDMQGSNIVIREGLNFIETDFDIHTVQNIDDTAIVEGDIIITDGSAHRQFDLRNFVAQTQGATKADSFKLMDNIAMRIDLNVIVRQFKASASMLNLDIDTNLRGQLKVEGPLSRPKVKGALAVSDGLIKFPATSFDLVNSQIVLDETSSKIFDPRIDIVATEELRTSDYSGLTKNTTVELSLRGDLDRLNIELRPIQGDLSLSQLKIFMLLLSPKNADPKDPLSDLKQGAKQAAMAFSGEVFLRPLTNELQELMEGATKTRIQLGSSFDPGGFTFRLNWKLGPRIELQGSYIFLNDKSVDITKNEDLDLGDLKLKLLLFDHKPLGPLSFESSFGTVRRRKEQSEEPKAKILLKYRIFYR